MNADPNAPEMMRAGGWQPLKGVKVLDFSLLLPGPFATLALADLGADVVKIEPPEGDFARQIPFAMFRMVNRNKRSVVLDLKRAEARPAVERLACWADIAIEGFRPGVAERLRIDHATLSAINPRLISCSLSGYGQSGPERLTPGHDLNYLAAAGALALCGHWSEPPRRSGLPVADLAAGSYAAIAILAALQERHSTARASTSISACPRRRCPTQRCGTASISTGRRAIISGPRTISSRQRTGSESRSASSRRSSGSVSSTPPATSRRISPMRRMAASRSGAPTATGSRPACAMSCACGRRAIGSPASRSMTCRPSG